MSILRNANMACLCRLKCPCPLSNLRNGRVPCHYLFGPQVAVAKVHVALWNLRNGPCRTVDFRGLGPYPCQGCKFSDFSLISVCSSKPLKKIIFEILFLEQVSHALMIDSDFLKTYLYHFRLFIEPHLHPCPPLPLSRGP